MAKTNALSVNLVKKRVYDLLFLNPWLTSKDIHAAVRISDYLLKKLLRDKKEIEPVIIPLSPRGYSKKYATVYSLTRAGQASHFSSENKLYRNGSLMTDSLLMRYERLGASRKLIFRLLRKKVIDWCASPWKPYRTAPYFDALLLVRTSEFHPDKNPALMNTGALLAIIMPLQIVNMDWYDKVIAAWGKWRKKTFAFPADLIIINPSGITKQFLYEKIRKKPRMNGGISVLCEDPPDLIKYLRLKAAGEKGKIDGAKPIERRYFSLKDLVGQIVTTPPAGFRKTLRETIQKNNHTSANVKKRIELIDAFIYRPRQQIEFLRTIALYPSVSPNTLALLYKNDQYVRGWGKQTAQLQKLGLVQKIIPRRRLFMVTEKAVRFFAHMHGYDYDYMDQCLGWPTRVEKLLAEWEHTKRTEEFILRLLWAKILTNWQFLTPRYKFTNIITPGQKNIPRIDIYPDSVVGLDVNGSDAWAWIEIDRGTRRGVRLERQLRKYFLIRYALNGPPISPLLYLVDNSAGLDETRLTHVAGKCAKLYNDFPQATFSVLFTTFANLNAQGDNRIDSAPIWRLFTKDGLEANPISLIEGMIRMHKNQKNKAAAAAGEG